MSAEWRRMLARAERELGQSKDDDATALLSEASQLHGLFPASAHPR
jgi:hypothetical protein